MIHKKAVSDRLNRGQSSPLIKKIVLSESLKFFAGFFRFSQFGIFEVLKICGILGIYKNFLDS
ncbi:hypothetical protein CCY99_06125 [Helicobacter sp. 16-1353]|uniref:hypothetical protein n=1 Tax=Helicobacter sp. 16-1353 TaxID=2004996 RepID=UPI000DCE9AB1|nr:hypothetical protein [Helicobacter sp. 16-1353]RAX53167.1 hypothetical protein CCY99_06125 [Helicobacter sp. 16-1353]